MPDTIQCFWLDYDDPGVFSSNDNTAIWKSTRTAAGVWSAKEKFYSIIDNPPAGADPDAFIDGFSSGVNAQGQTGQVAIALSLTQSGSIRSAQQIYYIGGNVAPVAIDDSGQPGAWDYFTVSQGPYFYNGHWWIFGQFGTIPAEPPLEQVVQMAVYKASSVGGPYTRMDSANEPTQVSGFWGQFDATDSKFRFLINTGGGPPSTFQLQEFDTATELWGSPHDTLTIDALGFQINQILYSSQTGKTFVSFFVTNSSGLQDSNFEYITCFDGVSTWSSPLQIPNSLTGATGHFNQMLLDPDGDTVHMFWQKESGGFSGSGIPYQQVQSSGTVLGPSSKIGNGDYVQAAPGHGLIFTDFDGTPKIWIPIDFANDNGLSPGAVYGSPLSNPVWSAVEVIDTFPGDSATCTYGVIVPKPGSSIVVFSRRIPSPERIKHR